MDEPLRATTVKRLAKKIVSGSGTTSFTRHAKEEMAKDALEPVDVDNVLCGGVASEGEFENGSWRYRITTQKICVVVAFRSEEEIVVITAWRNRS